MIYLAKLVWRLRATYHNNIGDANTTRGQFEAALTEYRRGRADLAAPR